MRPRNLSLAEAFVRFCPEGTYDLAGGCIPGQGGALPGPSLHAREIVALRALRAHRSRGRALKRIRSGRGASARSVSAT